MMKSFHVIRTYLPMSVEPPLEWLTSLSKLREVCSDLGRIFDLIEKSDPIGRIGKYGAVYGVALAAGGDVPLGGSHPLRVSKEEGGATAVLTFTTYAAYEVPLATIHAFTEEMAALHSWEHPVIESLRPSSGCRTNNVAVRIKHAYIKKLTTIWCGKCHPQINQRVLLFWKSLTLLQQNFSRVFLKRMAPSQWQKS